MCLRPSGFEREGSWIAKKKDMLSEFWAVLGAALGIASRVAIGAAICWRLLNLWFAKPMVWVRVAFHENDGNHENDENDGDNSDSYKQGVECWICGNHGNHEYDENHENPGCKPRVPQTIGLEIPEYVGDFFSGCIV